MPIITIFFIVELNILKLYIHFLIRYHLSAFLNNIIFDSFIKYSVGGSFDATLLFFQEHLSGLKIIHGGREQKVSNGDISLQHLPHDYNREYQTH